MAAPKEYTHFNTHRILR